METTIFRDGLSRAEVEATTPGAPAVEVVIEEGS